MIVYYICYFLILILIYLSFVVDWYNKNLRLVKQESISCIYTRISIGKSIHYMRSAIENNIPYSVPYRGW